ncbi:MAG: hypothetical protein P4L22_03590 [Candidatus Babeliales bacterium]|nr:hypothetical protein [Candidatus Babeliales bacterium]
MNKLIYVLLSFVLISSFNAYAIGFLTKLTTKGTSVSVKAAQSKLEIAKNNLQKAKELSKLADRGSGNPEEATLAVDAAQKKVAKAQKDLSNETAVHLENANSKVIKALNKQNEINKSSYAQNIRANEEKAKILDSQISTEISKSGGPNAKSAELSAKRTAAQQTAAADKAKINNKLAKAKAKTDAAIKEREDALESLRAQEELTSLQNKARETTTVSQRDAQSNVDLNSSVDVVPDVESREGISLTEMGL